MCKGGHTLGNISARNMLPSVWPPYNSQDNPTFTHMHGASCLQVRYNLGTIAWQKINNVIALRAYDLHLPERYCITCKMVGNTIHSLL